MKPGKFDLKRLSSLAESMGGMLIAVFFQVISFVLLTRTLGVMSFGIFVSAVAIGLAISELVGIGCGENFIRLVARNKDRMRPLFGNGLRMIAGTGILFALPLAPLAAYFIAPPYVFWAICALIANEAVIVRCTLYFEHVSLALDDFRLAAFARAIVPFFRCMALIFTIFALGHDQIPAMVIAQISATLVAALVMYVVLKRIINRQVDTPNAELGSLDWIKFGIPTALSNLQRGIQNHADKYIVTLFAGPEVGGVYAAGFRFVQMALIPVQAYARTTYSGFYDAGKNGLAASVSYGKRIGGIMLAIAVFCAACTYFGANFIPLILGEEYRQASDVVRILSPLLVFWGLQFLLIDALRGADLAWTVNWISLGINILSIVLLITLTMYYGLMGVLAASLISLGTALIVMAFAIWILLRKRHVTEEQPA
ncbi:MAG: oligosaccharide flippase family protein [Hyphomicrobiales bacterium]